MSDFLRLFSLHFTLQYRSLKLTRLRYITNIYIHIYLFNIFNGGLEAQKLFL